MGMAASQARFLQLTARKTNIEYMGQQINQQRLALANQSAGLFEKMLTLEPPVPPSSLDDKYYTQGYTFNDSTDDINKKVSWTTLQEAVSAGDVAGTDTFNVTYVDSSGTRPSAAIEPTGGALDIDELIANYTNNESVNGTDPSIATLLTNMGLSLNDDTTRAVVRFVTVEHAIYDPDGNYQTVQEQMPAILEFDNLERLINITPLDERLTYTSDYSAAAPTDWATLIAGDEQVSGQVGTGEELTYSGVFDEDRYNDDMNQYEFQKAAYDYQIERINLETAQIQKQDKSLELKMKQLDTEHKAIQTEMDAVQKVIQKNIESTFKTFG